MSEEEKKQCNCGKDCQCAKDGCNCDGECSCGK